MDQDRRKIIVREIEHWQRSKLLPEQYCDFLLNLYLDEGEQRVPQTLTGRAVQAITKASWKYWLLSSGVFSLICLVALYFNEFHPVLQIGVVASAVCVLLLIGQRFRGRNESLGMALVGSGMLLMLGMGLYMLKLHGLDGWGWKIGVLAGCAVFWIVFGIGARIPLLHLCGWMAFCLVYAWLLSKNAEEPAWYEIQLYWLPASFVFGWSSWFFHRWTRQVAAVLFATGALVWFMPELYAAVLAPNQEWLQIQLIVKVIAGGLLLFSLRKKWIVWVA